MIDSAVAHCCAESILWTYDEFDLAFKEITRRAQGRFEQRDWPGMRADAMERLGLYETKLVQVAEEACMVLATKSEDVETWKQVKRNYSEMFDGRPNLELAESFFNSVTHRIVTPSGINPETEYTNSGFAAPAPPPEEPIYRTYYPRESTAKTVEYILRDCQFRVAFGDLARDSHLAAERVEAQLWSVWHRPTWDRMEILNPVFYREKGAYIVGRIWKQEQVVPLMLALTNTEGGIVVDAVLMTSSEVSIVFGFAQSYFHVDVEQPRDLILFLKSILPLKRIAELYISIGHNRHGKRELFCDLRQHLRTSDDLFVTAPGTRGMVMVVFTLRRFPIVFKVIRDQFDHPKRTTRDRVMGKYHLVFRHDRVGRLVDAQEFEHVIFEKDRFSKEVLDELLGAAAQSVYVEGSRVIIKHLYAERRLTPLDLYVRDAPAEQVQEIIIDYGKAVKDLAAANIFPGDIFLKNFGVTRTGRVVFYDYDELTLLTECTFRRIPQARHIEDEFSAEPWFYVDENDVFPEEFAKFVGLNGPPRDAFFARHGDLCDVEFWTQMQQRQRSGEIIDVLPYKQRNRLRNGVVMGGEFYDIQ